MVVIDEQRDMQVSDAEADAQFWDDLRDMHRENIEDHRSLIATAERRIAESQVGMTDAAANAAKARDRAERLKRGEAVPVIEAADARGQRANNARGRLDDARLAPCGMAP
jgi:hypothetical protein